MIDLGLSRVIRLLSALGNPHLAWKAVHVAGTNGKGSVCAYISSSINAAKIPNGRFTSPHLVDRFDCISINGQPVREQLFLEVEKTVAGVNADNNIQATDFELLTAVAFEIFRRQQVQLAVIEVGLGGRLDATNVLSASQTLCTIITKIGLDHQNFLGNTLVEIAREKAGIIKQGVACIVDGTNEETVIKEIRKIAEEKNSEITVAEPLELSGTSSLPPFNVDPSSTPLLGSYQMSNLSCSLQALSKISKELPVISDKVVQKGIRETKWPGRLQWTEINLDRGYIKKSNEVLPASSRLFKVLLDGAHNNQAADLLAEYINTSVRTEDQKASGVTFIVAFSHGKDFAGILARLVKPGDNVIATQFGPVDGMPWVRPCDPQEVIEVSRTLTTSVSSKEDISKCITTANELGKKTIICGSLYLVSDFLRRYSEKN